MLGLIEGIIMVVLCIILPPLAVLLEDGCGMSLLLNVILCLFGWLPGVLHALYVTIAVPMAAESGPVVVSGAPGVGVSPVGAAVPPYSSTGISSGVARPGEAYGVARPLGALDAPAGSTISARA